MIHESTLWEIIGMSDGRLGKGKGITLREIP